MKLNLRSALMMGCLAATTACAASDESPDAAPENLALVGSYATAVGGTLEIFEAGRGDFLISESIPADAYDDDVTGGARADDGSRTLGELYRALVGGVVPKELRAAEQRQQQRAVGDAASEAWRTPAAPVASLLEEPPRDVRSDVVIDKLADRNIEQFRARDCRDGNQYEGSEGCVSVRVCWTERKGSGTVRESGLFGNITAVRPYRGSVILEVLYDGQRKTSRTIDEGTTHRVWKSDPDASRAYALEVSVKSEDSGWNLAVVGTKQARYASQYGTAAVEGNYYACGIRRLGPVTAGQPVN